MVRGEAKERICKAAVRLFNEEGYDAVSLRQIAAEAGTTIGNLTYHYRRKDDLLAAILSDLHAGYVGLLNRSLEGTALLEHLVALFVASEENQGNYPFYFGNLSQIMATSPSLKEENDLFAARICSYYEWALRRLRDVGIVRMRRSDSELEVLAYGLVTMQSGWTQQSSPYNNESLSRISMARALSTMLMAYIDDGLLTEYATICSRLGVELKADD